ncbi:MAG: DUF4293 family protein [Balneolaceae bacterium]|nr:MAG: DUF4293 family protein [Balneolaceae bacterium]
MIQRPQTIFLAFAVIANLIVFFTPIYRHAVNDPAGWIGLGFAISLTLAMIIALVSIFLFKNRINQLKWVKMATYIQIVGLGFAAGVLFSLGGFGTFLWREVLSSGLIVIALAMFWLAGRSIKKDEELVKSMDRIR